MKSFLTGLKHRNPTLYWFGLYNLAVAIVCIILAQFDSTQILGISRWIKPMKFYASVFLMVWTMDWILYYLNNRKNIRVITGFIVATMFFENFLILLQSIRGVRSHFNVQTATDGMLFGFMGMIILIFSFTIIYATWLFFRQKEFHITDSYLWGIRLGLLFFIIFSFEAGFMLALMAHTVGAPDGGPGSRL